MSDASEVKAWTLEQIMSKHLEPDRPLMGPWVEESDHDRIVAELQVRLQEAEDVISYYRHTIHYNFDSLEAQKYLQKYGLEEKEGEKDND